MKTTTCLNTVVGGKQGHAPCRILALQQFIFSVSVVCHGGHKAVIILYKSRHPQFEGITGAKTVESVCLSSITSLWFSHGVRQL